MNTPRRLEPDTRRAAILTAAVDLAAAKGYLTLTRDDVAHAAGVSAGLVTRYFFAMPELRLRLMEEAVRRELLPVIAQGLAYGCPTACAAPVWLRAKALSTLAG
jgi:AcrR family transcriptional regulator